MGNPLLDMQVTDGEKLLEKYKLNANDAILAGPEHAAMYVLQFSLSIRQTTLNSTLKAMMICFKTIT